MSVPGSRLRELLTRTPPPDQDAILVASTADVSSEELVDLIVNPVVPRGSFVISRLESLLIGRGAQAVDALSSAMSERPYARTTRHFAKLLAEIARREPDQTIKATTIVATTVEAALDSGADTWEVGELLGWYLDIVESADITLADDSRGHSLATRIAALAETESYPYLLAVDRARRRLDS